jgi:hypothetical protein
MSNGKENMTVLIKYPQQNKITNADFLKEKMMKESIGLIGEVGLIPMVRLAVNMVNLL